MEHIGTVKIAMKQEPKVLPFPNSWKEPTAISTTKLQSKVIFKKQKLDFWN
jgi:hypothetical protein